jgi:hypothetical protein
MTISTGRADAFRCALRRMRALEKGVYDKLTPGQADAIAEFCFEFRRQVMEANDR